MGQVVSAFWSLFASDKEFKILLVGLDNAGKTTTLYQLHLGQAVATQPTIGSNVETVKHKNVHFEVRTARIQWIRRLGGRPCARAKLRSPPAPPSLGFAI